MNDLVERFIKDQINILNVNEAKKALKIQLKDESNRQSALRQLAEIAISPERTHTVNSAFHDGAGDFYYQYFFTGSNNPNFDDATGVYVIETNINEGRYQVCEYEFNLVHGSSREEYTISQVK